MAARHEALREAGLMMSSALAIRACTSGEIGPLVSHSMRSSLLPQSVPSCAATQNSLNLREGYPKYAHKEATLNPTHSRATRLS